MNLRNKRGAEKLMSVYWFAILILVAGTIVYMVSVFYGNPYDVREIETNILINKAADCLSDEGKLRYQLTEELETNFLEKCHLNFGNENEELEYYLEIEFYDFKTNNLLDFRISKGNINLKNYIEDFPDSNSVISTSKSFYVLNDKDEELIVKVLSIIRKTEKNVK